MSDRLSGELGEESSLLAEHLDRGGDGEGEGEGGGEGASVRISLGMEPNNDCWKGVK